MSCDQDNIDDVVECSICNGDCRLKDSYVYDSTNGIVVVCQSCNIDYND